MTITANPSVRQVLAQMVRDPRYPGIARKPLLSPAHIGLVVGVYTAFGLASWGYLSGTIPFLLMLLINQAAIYASFTVLHDAVHGSVSRNPRLNDFLGTVSAGLLLPGISTTVYRILHMEHHRWVGDKNKDPDLPFVETPRALLPLVLLIPEWIWTHFYFTKLWRTRPKREVAMFVLTLIIYVGLQVGFLLSPYWKEFLLVWLIPQKVGMFILVYAFAHVQHPHDSDWQNSPFQSTVQLRGTAVGKVYWLGQTDHCIHHAMPHIPFHRYHRVWDLGDSVLRNQGIPTRGLFKAPKEWGFPRAPYQTVRQVRVTEAREAGAGVRTFVLEGVDGPLSLFTPGSHVDVHLPSGRIRQYSLCNAPDTTYRIAVKADPHGRGGSLEVHEALTLGTTLTISEPRNNFELNEAGRYVLVAGGIGATPLLSMAHDLHAAGAEFTLHLCAQDEASVPFGDDLAALPFADRVYVHTDREPGRTSFDPAAKLGGWGGGAELYLCGPNGFMDWLSGQATAQGWPLDTVHRESFTAPVVDVTASVPFEVELARSGITFTVPADKQILDVLAEKQVVVPWSCSQGVCGACITPVLSGEIEHRDAVLPADVRAANTKMCLCVSRAKCGRIVLDL
ncbi:MAG TPA: fatty acid desaturase [Sporichthyaceae bacterium]|nr:fatty acid desaturase [Sporichthyaceae bacterium]